MGYACPVCEDPQMDAEHLANHLAISAVLGREDHEAWLDEHAPGWDDQGPDELGPRVADHAVEREFPQVFEDTTDDHGAGHDHTHGRGGAEGSFEQELASQARHRGRGALNVEDDVYEEARRMTEAMQGGEDEGPDGAGETDAEESDIAGEADDATADDADAKEKR